MSLILRRDVGLALKQAREGRGWSCDRLARELRREGVPVSRRAIGDWESGRTRFWRHDDKLAACAKVLGVPIESLMGSSGSAVTEAVPQDPLPFAPYGLLPLVQAVPHADTWTDPSEVEGTVSVEWRCVRPGRFASRISGSLPGSGLMQGDLAVWQLDDSPPPQVLVLATGPEACAYVAQVPPGGGAAPTLCGPPELVPVPKRTVARLVAVVRSLPGRAEVTWWQPAGLRPEDLEP